MPRELDYACYALKFDKEGEERVEVMEKGFAGDCLSTSSV